MGGAMSPFSLSGFYSPDGWPELVRVLVRVHWVLVRVPRSDCPGSCPSPNPDTRGTLGGPASGFSP